MSYGIREISRKCKIVLEICHILSRWCNKGVKWCQVGVRGCQKLVKLPYGVRKWSKKIQIVSGERQFLQEGVK